MTTWDETEKDIYETQLRNLQEQLVDTMIENQSLGKNRQTFLILSPGMIFFNEFLQI